MNIKVIRSEKRERKYWIKKPDLKLSTEYDTKRNVIAVNTKEQYQKFMGFGGAFTEAASITFNELDKKGKKEAVRAYFNKEKGLGYTLGRVHIHSCDFSLGNYTYIDEGDIELKSFDISREEETTIPLIHLATEEAEEKLTILASPWSPPSFMKDTKEMNYGGKLLNEYKNSWANYYVKFIEEMEKRDVPIWGVSVQNEPAAVQSWDSCIYTAEDERDFIKNNLGPAMHNAGYEDKAIIIWDHNRDIIVERAATVLSDKEANKYIWGVGNHWYMSEAFENLSIVKNMFPDKHLLFTEGCVEFGIYGSESRWENAEMYGRNIIGDFNNWSEGWIDWNLYLNEIGGPNHVGNYCEAPIMIDRDKKELIYNCSYYYIGHFSKYIQKGARRISTELNTEKVYAVSFKNPNGGIAIIIQNEGWIQEMSLVVDGLGVNITLPDRSITTYVIKN